MRSRSLLALLFALSCASENAPDLGAMDMDMGEASLDLGLAEDLGAQAEDLGRPDLGPPDCSSNPSGCAPMQQLGPDCRCLSSCEGDLIWNPISGSCEMPPAGECAVDSDCGSDGVCLNTPMGGGIAPCMGEASCACFISCDPFVGLPQSGCSPGQACTWLGNPAGVTVEAICLPEGQGGLQAAPCSASAECNRNQNFFCTGATMTSTGACARVCSGASPGLCESLGDFSCAPLNDPELPDIGLCRATPPLFTDLATACAMGGDCQSGLCSMVLLGACSASCGGIQACPGGSVCVGINGMVPPGEANLCMLECPSADPAGDAFCQARSQGLICRNILGMGPPICTPPCTVIGCPMGTTCEMGSGRCQ